MLTIKLDHGKRPSSMVQLHGPWCKLALSIQGEDIIERTNAKHHWCTLEVDWFTIV